MENKRSICECFVGGDFIYGGMEEFIICMLAKFSNPQLKYTLFVPGHIYNKKINDLENKSLDVVAWNMNYHSSLLGKIRLFSAYKKFFQKTHFEVVHIHGANIIDLALAVLAAKKSGVKQVIVHSHNTAISNLKNKIKRKICIRIFKKHVNKYLACSRAAAEWMFPNKIISNNEFQIINNGINLDSFIFNPGIREQYRNDFKLTNEFVLCNVGRFHSQKNHEFLIEIAKILNEKQFDYKFILVGDGPLKSEIIKKIDEYGLQEKFIFLEKRNDISQIMMASDAFVMPSRFEGLPVTLIEAQATGLKVFASETITTEVGITDLIKFVPITDPNVWAEEIMNYNQHIKREQYAEIVAKAGYSAEASAKLLENIYLGNQ